MRPATCLTRGAESTLTATSREFLSVRICVQSARICAFDRTRLLIYPNRIPSNENGSPAATAKYKSQPHNPENPKNAGGTIKPRYESSETIKIQIRTTL